MEELSISYFRDLLSKNVDSLKGLCQTWETMQIDTSLPEEVCDEIRTTIGLTNLLLCQKLKQFNGLIDDSEFNRGEKEITCLDLQGFWDMVYNEVEKIEKRFEKLEKSKLNNWVLAEETKLETENKKRLLPAIAKTKIVTKNYASAARQRLAEAKLKMKAQIAAQRTTDTAQSNVNSDILKRIESPKKETSKKSNSKELIISNITNRQQQKEQNPKMNSAKKNPKSRKKDEIPEKENIMLPSSESKGRSPGNRKGKAKQKEFIPLQCVTRSAARKAKELGKK